MGVLAFVFCYAVCFLGALEDGIQLHSKDTSSQGIEVGRHYVYGSEAESFTQRSNMLG